jgi:hypothetical protein
MGIWTFATPRPWPLLGADLNDVAVTPGRKQADTGRLALHDGVCSDR